jgi:hypothetical protein
MGRPGAGKTGDERGRRPIQERKSHMTKGEREKKRPLYLIRDDAKGRKKTIFATMSKSPPDSRAIRHRMYNSVDCWPYFLREFETLDG